VYNTISQHIQKKRKGTAQEAWEVVFESDPLLIQMRSPEQLNFLPYIRYWTIGETKREKHRETMNLITAFEPDHQRIDLYEKLKKKAENR
jgi:hypothetical protein